MLALIGSTPSCVCICSTCNASSLYGFSPGALSRRLAQLQQQQQQSEDMYMHERSCVLVLCTVAPLLVYCVSTPCACLGQYAACAYFLALLYQRIRPCWWHVLSVMFVLQQ
jgi:hypothetical protein